MSVGEHDFNDDKEEEANLETSTVVESTNDESPEGARSPLGKMARWTEEELTFLADQKALGKGRKDCVKAYFEKFGHTRSEASVNLKVPTTSRASAGPTRPANYPKPTRKGVSSAPVLPVTVAEEYEEPEEVSAEPTLTPFMQSMSHFMESFATTSKAMTNARGSLKGKDLDTYQSVTKHYLLTLVT